MNPIPIRLLACFGGLAFLFTISIGASSSRAQFDLNEQIEQFKVGTTAERVGNVRALSTLVIRDYANDEEKAKILGFLKSAVNDDDEVVRLTVHVELLKIGAGNKDKELINLAMSAVDDKNINVRREILKYFSAFFSGRMDAGIQQKEMLLKKLDDPDLESRFQVAKTLLSWEILNDKVIDILLDSLEMGNYRSVVTYALSTVPNREAVVARVLDRLKKSSHNAAVLINVVAHMGQGAKTAVGDLLSMYESDEAMVRASVIDAIGRVGLSSDEAINTLEKAVLDEALEVRQLALVSAFSVASNQTERLSKLVIRLLDDESRDVREVAASFACINPELFDKCLPKFREILAGQEADSRYSIMGVLANAGPIAGPLTNEIKGLLDSESAEMRGAACWALLEIAADKASVTAAINREITKTSADDESLGVLIGALAEAQPSDKESQQTFLKHLQHKNSNVRFASLAGLANYDSSDYAESMLTLAKSRATRNSLLYNHLDRIIVNTICNQKIGAGELARKFLSDDTANHVRSRAIRILAKSQPNGADVKELVLKLLDDESPDVRFAAADSLKYLPTVPLDALDKLVSRMNGNHRRLTVGYLKLIGDLGEKAAPVVPQLVELMNGKFRNRFANDARATVVSLAAYVQKPVSALVAEPITVQKLDCLAAIGQLDEPTEKALRDFMAKSRTAALSAQNLNTARSNRRAELLAAAALANCLSDSSIVNTELLAELKTDNPSLGLLAISKLKSVDKAIIDAIVSRLPEVQSIESLTKLGSQAKPASPRLRELIDSNDPKIAALAKRALWRIENDQELAMKTLKEILAANQMEPGEIRLADRQATWELLRYLHDKHSDVQEVRQLLDSIEKGRFRNLRSFVKNLRSDSA